ncbi:hypothetical protein EJ04DRAFT_545929 [Polyplosphaeria fusca]|uniref:peptidylprolyl isomerase n=1 Tax=Polyplosphaeria fusca TaxID=682080 RepID=A0A9P4QMK0_9PLEO|nr:hypothetical protein EJ04DRAFT_545929 [Polyplosphaeria fusca]
MAAMLPMSVYGLRVPAGGILIPARDYDGTVRITMAAIDPTAETLADEEDKPVRATLKLIRVPSISDEDEDEDEDDSDDEDYDEADFEAIKSRLPKELLGSEDEDAMSEDEDDDSEDEKNGGPSDPAKAMQAKREAVAKKLLEVMQAEEMELDNLENGVNGVKSKGKAKALDDDDSSEDDEDDDDDESASEVEEYVLCTLDPEKHYQQPLDITLGEHEHVFFVVVGTHDVFLTGNYVLPPDEDFGESGEEDEDMFDLPPDEDELDDDFSEDEDDALDGLPDPRVTEVGSDEEDEAPKLVTAGKKGKNKRPAESDDDDLEEATTLDELISKTMKPETNGEPKLSKKQAKKLKKNDGQATAAAQESKKDTKDKNEPPGSDKKKVQFAKNLEQGPTGSPKVDAKEAPAVKTETPAKTGPRNVNGVTVEDKKLGKGPAAKKGSKVGMRYIGKLKNGKQFDSNKKGKPFTFKVGAGEVIKGWDIGVAGMTAGGERRLTIPAKLAYGNKALPDIPANSELIFDIKCLTVN